MVVILSLFLSYIFCNFARVMVFDVARHRFAEGFLTLLLFALIASVAVMVGGEVVPIEGAAPLRGFIDSLTVQYPVATAVALFLMLVYAGLRLARSTVRVGIYSATSMGVMALSAVSMLQCVVSTNYLYIAVVVLLVTVLISRLLYCFGAKVRVDFLFAAMLSAGVMPLVDNALIPLSLVVSIIVIFLRASLRETIVVLLGVSLPTLLYCYVLWLFGNDFGTTFLEVWNGGLVEQHQAVVAYLTIQRLIFLGVVLLLYICSVVFYFKARVTLLDHVRSIWRLLMVLQLLLVAMLILMPTASEALVVAMIIIMTVMLPQFFLSVDVPTATIAYIALMVSSLATIY